MTYRVASIFPAPAEPAKPVKVLAFDQSTHCGWAILGPELKRPEWGVLELRVAPDGDETPMWRPLRAFIEEAVQEKGVTHVFFEQPMMPNKNYPATEHGQRQWMMCSVIQDNTDRLLGRSAEQVSASAWRKLFLGRGALRQEDMAPGLKLKNAGHRRRSWKLNTMAKCAEWGWLVDNDNAADALGIGVFGLSTISQSFLVRQGSLFRRAEMQAQRIP